MIDLYSGTPGSGKSLHMAKDIYYILKSGGLVIANFPLNEDFLKSKKCKGKFVFLPDDSLRVPHEVIVLITAWIDEYPKKRILLCLDECQTLFNARTWNISGRAEWIQFFALHRHLSKEACNVILVTQEDLSLDKQIRKKIECEYKHYKLKNGSNGMFLLSMLFRGNLFKYVSYWYGQRVKLNSCLYVAGKKYFSIYDTHGSFNGKKIPEKELDKARKLFES